VRKLQIYVDKYGPEVGPKLFHLLQSQAAHAGVSARLRKKIEAIRNRGLRPLPLFDQGPRSTEQVDDRSPEFNPADVLPSPPLGR
jgi:hypothetical protein